jgi:hypothetical protein
MHVLSLLAVLANFPSGPAEVSLGSLLNEMHELKRLARRPVPGYMAAQASSYDRASAEPGNEAWFANADAGKFLRTEEKPDRKEHVMADLKGPGAVVRIWSANPVGVIRFYFDGEQEARFAWRMSDLLTGKVEPFGDPFAYMSARGTNLYFPIPYARSLKITADDTQDNAARHLYYHVGYRTYPPTTDLRSLTQADLARSQPEIERAAAALKGLAAADDRGELRGRRALLFANLHEPFLTAAGPGAITLLRFRFRKADGPDIVEGAPWDHPANLHNALRQVRFIADFDGERSVDVPIPDFFCTAGGLLPFATQPIQVGEDGWLTCRFVMPFAREAKLALVSLGGPPLEVEHEATVAPFAFDAGTYLFRAQWLGDRLGSRPMRDMEFVKARGEGVFVGTSLHIANPTTAWWGEGDEKVYVDGESFPSTFGTGTEDYFGYAWCDPTPYARPYHAQPRCDGPGNRGHTNIVRWQTFDPIPFRTGLDFFIELWHWADVQVDYDRVAYWYSRPGGSLPRQVENSKLLWLTHIPKPEPIKGAIEGEKLPIVSKSGGETEIQGFGALSSGQQLWWRDAKEGDRLVLRVPVPADGRYEVTGNFCHAKDYGIHRLSIGGKLLADRLDFYSSGLEWKVLGFGTHELKGGTAEVVIESLGHRQEAIPRNMFGLDYLILKRVDTLPVRP